MGTYPSFSSVWEDFLAEGAFKLALKTVTTQLLGSTRAEWSRGVPSGPGW